tara:strand:- start:5164 stop:5367 length:204 start_codon:yes stop_codon:yes gene_type:complete
MKIVLVIIIWLNTGVVTSTVNEVDACPPKGPLFAKYEKLKADGALLEWAALCAPMEYKPINKPKVGV